jgi:hypothetical protein
MRRADVNDKLLGDFVIVLAPKALLSVSDLIEKGSLLLQRQSHKSMKILF